MTPRVLITGASGLLGATLVERWSERYDVFATGGSDFAGNLARRYQVFDLKAESYSPLLGWARPDVIVHGAALTNVDACEDDPAAADAVNAESVRKLAAAAPDARIVFISTDAVFGDDNRPATEQTAPAPLNAYGRSKLRGETWLRELPGRHCIVRTTIVGRNLNRAKRSLADWIVGALAEGKPITLFSDALFSPIAVTALADELGWVIDADPPPLLHIGGREPVSKLELGYRLCRRLGFDEAMIRPGSMVGFPFKARRCRDQTLDSSLYVSLSRRRLPGVDDTVAALTPDVEN